MFKFYPYINHQEDLEAVVESEYNAKTGDTLPPLFLKKLIEHRRSTIIKAMEEERTIKFDRLGKLKITNSKRDKRIIIEKLGDDYTPSKFKNELKTRYNKGQLLSQKFSKSTDKRRKNVRGKYTRLTIAKSNNE